MNISRKWLIIGGGTLALTGLGYVAAPAIALKLGSTGMLGKAATGASISKLTGAAKVSASLAKIGGGAKIIGGAGMAGGKAVIATTSAAVGAGTGKIVADKCKNNKNS